MPRDSNTFQRNTKSQKKRNKQNKYGKYSGKHARLRKGDKASLKQPSNLQKISITSVSHI